MLKLKNIVKHYYVGDMTVEALKGINLNFRKNEFVSILGPSGCGKTTTLNIIGGLDQYTSGDLVINGVSTKNYKDHDWDVYRNHRIGFIFQSYNLIPHQTVLGNVELALTISGISKQERTERAKKALDRVGLQGQYKKHPNQLSGGQCQRVAIARALVNEPDILLADEPTGALDTETSVQIMDLIKEISNEKLVIMVTHNPDLAYKYSTRIVKFIDGEIIDDSNPFSEEDEASEVALSKACEEEKVKEGLQAIPEDDINERKKYQKNLHAKEKAKMSLWTAFKLSARNLWTKRARTFMIGIAGSIGIIGVSTVLGVSQGVNDYIKVMQDDMLSGNPISVSRISYDYSLLTGGTTLSAVKSAAERAGGIVYTRQVLDMLVNNEAALLNMVHQNEITNDYVSYIKTMPTDYYNDISINYGIDIAKSIYTDFKLITDDELEGINGTTEYEKYQGYDSYNRNMSVSAITDTYSQAISFLTDSYEYAPFSSLITGLTTPVSQLLNNKDYVLSQYDMIDNGHWPEKANEVLLVLNKDQSLEDLSLAQLGYYSQKGFYDLVSSSLFPNGDVTSKTEFSFNEIYSRNFTWYPNNLIYSVNEDGTITYNYEKQDSWKTVDVSNESYLQNPSNEKGVPLKISGILRIKDDVSYGCLNSGLAYTEDFARYITYANQKDALKPYYQIMISDILSTGQFESKASIIQSPLQITEEEFNTGEYYEKISSSLTPLYVKAESYSSENYYYQMKKQGCVYDLDFVWMQYNNSGALKTSGTHVATLALTASSDLQSTAASYFSGKTATSSMTAFDLGITDAVYEINVYPKNFEEKDKVTNYMDAWNSVNDVTVGNFDEDLAYNYYNNMTSTKTLASTDRLTSGEIKYTDSVGLIINLISTMINIVTYALVAFTALSLVVSSVMIAIITYVSVMERIKEIGVIRSLGGRKKDVSHLFNAETLIIGFTSGVLGVAISYLLCLLINLIVNGLSNGTVSTIANLTPLTALIMILISVLLTVIAGFVPSRSAAKKDPVVALRTE